MKKIYWYIVALVLIIVLVIIDGYYSKTFSKGILFALGTAFGYMVAACFQNARKERNKK